MEPSTFEVIIIGGSYAGLSAALTLGRSLRRVLIIDSGKPCNRFTTHSQNFITQDGEVPSEIARKAKEQVLQYDTVTFYEGLAENALKTANGFQIICADGNEFSAQQLIIATGLKDIMPTIDGFAECWGKSIIHCPYCHGYEYKAKNTAILANGDIAFHYSPLVANLAKKVSVLTNGNSTLTEERRVLLKQNSIEVIEKKVQIIRQENGKVKEVQFMDGTALPVDVIYSAPETTQQTKIPEQLGCEITEEGLIKINDFQQTTVDGVYACGDNSGMRAVAQAVAAGNSTGAYLNFILCSKNFDHKK